MLKEAREKINEIDRKMASLFEERMKAVEDVVSYKLENNLPVLDSTREKEVVERNLSLINEEKYKEYYKMFIKDMMDVSKKYQREIINPGAVGYQGVKGAFSHLALRNLFSDSKEKAFDTFEDVFKAVQDGEIKSGVIPFENSYTGEVGEVMDLLYSYDCCISEIYDMRINQNLLGVHGAKIEDIKSVYSKDQALFQCRDFLDKYDFEQIPYLNTAKAAEFIKEQNDKTKAAVASIETAKLYDLEVLQKNINSKKDNTTRFIVITKNKQSHGNRFSILFTLDNNAGQLAKAMQIVAKHGVNLESIKSKSLHNLAWQYYFYIEGVGDATSDENVLKMIDELKEVCLKLKILGVYYKREEALE